MTKLHILILVMCITFLLGCRNDGILIEGARFENNTLVPLKGYSLALQENGGRTEAILFRQADRGIKGKFFCICGNNDGGGCKVVIVGNGLSCAESVCQDCVFGVTIDSLTGGKFFHD